MLLCVGTLWIAPVRGKEGFLERERERGKVVSGTGVCGPHVFFCLAPEIFQVVVLSGENPEM